MRARTHWSVWLGVWLCATSLLIAGHAAAQSPVQSPAGARTLLLKMAEVLGGAQQLSATAHTAYDSVQPSGQKIEWNELRTLTLRRPDRLRLESEQSNGTRTLVVFDGKQISTFDEVAKAYAQAPQPGGIDETLVYLVRDLGVRLPLAVLFVSQSAPALDRRVKSIAYVEKTGILGVPTHHLVGRTDSVDFQIWITEGDQPVPRRIVLTYRGATGQPQFRGDFTNWNFAPTTTDATFAFAAPAGANKVPFAAAVAQSRAASARTSAKKGAQP